MNLNLKLEEVREEVLDLLGHGMDDGGELVEKSPFAEQVSSAWAFVDPDSPIQEELNEQYERLNQDKEEAVANQDFERAAALRDQADILRRRARVEDLEWRKYITRFRYHPWVQLYRTEITHLNAKFSGRVDQNTDQIRVEEARTHCLRLKRSLYQLYQRLEKEPNYGLPNDTVSKFTQVIPWFEGQCVRHDELQTCLRGIRDGRRILIVGPPGSGRKTLVGGLAHEIFRETAEAGKTPVQLVALNHWALGETDQYAEELADILAALRANECYLLALEELHLCAEVACDSPEVVEAWRLGMFECLKTKHTFVAWTTPSGAERLQAVWPTLLREAVVLRLSPIPDDVLRIIVSERMGVITRTRSVFFSEDFVNTLLDVRRTWEGAGLSDPGLTLDLLDRVVDHSARTGTLNLGPEHIHEFVNGVKVYS